MSDLYCRNPQCREPWDSYGVYQCEDMTKEEAVAFRAGYGCPSCHFALTPGLLNKEFTLEHNNGSFIVRESGESPPTDYDENWDDSWDEEDDAWAGDILIPQGEGPLARAIRLRKLEDKRHIA